MADNSHQLFERAWQIAESVRELPSAERRSAVDTACGDNCELAKKVGALLTTPTSAVLLAGSVQQVAGDMLVESASDLIDDIGPGDQVGTYRLIEELGVGGMSRVYLATREGVEFEQKVAVKLMRAFGTAQADSRARFEREQQVLATLSHPNIANIIDGGVTPSNRPFLVMEYVNGETVIDYCRTHNLGLDARLDLFADICAAVEHAHRGLIVHRDLKPSNILVNEDGQVKLLDFGIAKLLDDSGSAQLTSTGLMMLTPQYAAPEQVTGAPITTATDVYALGLLLYELLVEAKAWDADGLSVAEQLLNICEKMPARPSSVTQSTQWSSQIRGDLDLIVNKALSKAPAERYPTCTELVRDLNAWRSGEPVSAHAPSAMYRLRKFTQRHWVGVFTLLAFAGVVGFFIVALLQQQDATRLERDRAQEAQAATGAINRFFIDELLGATSSDAAYGRDVPVSLMLERAEQTAGRAFANQPQLEASVRETLGRTFLRLGDLERASKNLAAAEDRLTNESTATQSNFDRIELLRAELQIVQGDASGAREVARLILSRLQATSGLEHIDTLAAKIVLARAQKALDEWPEAQKNLTEALDVLGREFPEMWRMRSEALLVLAKVLFEQRNAVDALEALNKRHELQTNYLGENHPDLLDTLRWQSTVLYRLQRTQEALRAAESGYALAQRVFGEGDPETGEAADNLGRRYIRVGRYDEAVILFQESIKAATHIHGENHSLTLAAKKNLGVALYYAGRLEEAEIVQREAYASFKALHGERHSQTIRAFKNFAGTLLAQGKTRQYREAVERLVQISRSFDGDTESDPILLNDAAWFLLNCELVDLRDPVAALTIARQAVDRAGRKQGESLITLADALAANGYPDKAIETYEEAAANTAVLHIHSLPRNLAVLYQRTNQIERGEAFFRQHLERRRAVRGDNDWLLGMTWHELGRFYVNAELGERAVPVLEQAIAQYLLTREANDSLIMRSRAALGAAQSQVGEFKAGEDNMLVAYNALLANVQVTSDIKREIISWLIQLYTTLENGDELAKWELELAARQSEPLFSDWTRQR